MIFWGLTKKEKGPKTMPIFYDLLKTYLTLTRCFLGLTRRKGKSVILSFVYPRFCDLFICSSLKYPTKSFRNMKPKKMTQIVELIG